MELRAEGRLEEALDLLSMPGDFSADAYTLRGDIQLELGRVQEAAGSYFTVVAAKPEHLYANHNLALCLRRLERWEAAMEPLQRILNLDPHRDQDRIGLGDCLLHLNRPEEALECFDRCWSDGARGQALFGKAVALQLLRRNEDARAVYERLLSFEPKAEEALANLVAIGLEAFDLEQVQQYSLELLKLNPRSRTAMQGLAVVALERGQEREAANYFSQIVDSNAVERGPLWFPMKGVEDDYASIEYRLSREVVERLQSLGRR